MAMRRLAALLVASALLSGPALAQATFVVTSAADPGDGTCDAAGAGDGCTLREAIAAADLSGEIDSVFFDIPGDGVQTIHLTSPLPAITQRVVIDGYTQPGSSPNTRAVGNDAVLLIEVDASGTGSSGGPILDINCSPLGGRCLVDGLVVVRGLVLNNGGTGAGSSGIRFNGSGIRVEGNFIGTDPSGTVARPNGFGIEMSHSGPTDAVIGGTEPAQRNLISGNRFDGVSLGGNPANPPQDRTRVQGNYIGTDASGLNALGNGRDGITSGLSKNLRVGGAEPGAGNVIAANGRTGVFMAASTTTSLRTVDAVVQGNHIGVGADGTTPLGNTAEGVLMNHSGHVIGGTDAGAGNVIAHNGEGVRANFAVTDVLVAGNEVYGHVGSGVVVGAASSGIGVTENAVYGNGGLGIDLVGCNEPAPSSPSPNDAGDADDGPNRCQNHPSIFGTAIGAGGDLLVVFSVDSAPTNAAYPLTVEFFTAAPDAGGAEGEAFLGSATYSEADWSAGGSAPGRATANLGNAAALGVALTDPLVATATDADGNTSEFGPGHIVGTPSEAAPSEGPVALHAPTPNPSGGRAVVVFDLPEAGPVRLGVYDALGRETAVLVDGPRAAGRHEAVLDGTDWPSGVYLIRLTASGGATRTRPLTLTL